MHSISSSVVRPLVLSLRAGVTILWYQWREVVNKGLAVPLTIATTTNKYVHFDDIRKPTCWRPIPAIAISRDANGSKNKLWSVESHGCQCVAMDEPQLKCICSTWRHRIGLFAQQECCSCSANCAVSAGYFVRTRDIYTSRKKSTDSIKVTSSPTSPVACSAVRASSKLSSWFQPDLSHLVKYYAFITGVAGVISELCTSGSLWFIIWFTISGRAAGQLQGRP